MSKGVMQQLGSADHTNPSSPVFKPMLEGRVFEESTLYYLQKQSADKKRKDDDYFDALEFAAYREYCDLSTQLRVQQAEILKAFALDEAQFQQKLQAQRNWEKVEASLAPRPVSPETDAIAGLSKALSLEYKLKTVLDDAFLLRHWKKTEWKPAVKKAARAAAQSIANEITEKLKNDRVYQALLASLPEPARDAILKEMDQRQVEMTTNLARALGTETTLDDKVRIMPELVTVAKAENKTVAEVVEQGDALHRQVNVAGNLRDYFQDFYRLCQKHELDKTNPETFGYWQPTRLAVQYANNRQCRDILNVYRNALSEKYKSYPGGPFQVNTLANEADHLKTDLVQTLKQLENIRPRPRPGQVKKRIHEDLENIDLRNLARFGG